VASARFCRRWCFAISTTVQPPSALLKPAGLGSVGGGLIVGGVSQQFSVGQVLVGLGALMGFSFALLGASHELAWSLVACAAAGLGQAALNSFFHAFFQAMVPPELMGRRFGILGTIDNSAGPIAALAAGVLGGIYGEGLVMATGAFGWRHRAGSLLICNRRARTTPMIETSAAKLRWLRGCNTEVSRRDGKIS